MERNGNNGNRDRIYIVMDKYEK